MLKSLLLLFAFLGFSSVTAQEVTMLRGKLVSDSVVESSINIVNLTRKSGTTNNSTGGFQIEVMENDSLMFSSVQYEIVEVVVTSEILRKGFLEVELEDKTTELDEVSISNVSLTGNLGQDAANIKTSTPADFGLYTSEKPPPTSIERKLYTAQSSSFDGVLNSISGRTAMLEKAKENEEKSFLVQEGMQAFPASYFLEELKIPEDQIKNFVYFCAENPRFSELLPEEKRFALIEYYSKKAPEFLENRMEK